MRFVKSRSVSVSVKNTGNDHIAVLADINERNTVNIKPFAPPPKT